jgi:predicted flap endonuclease-1-like 5' DNA nuclease
MEARLLWFILAGFLLGFTASTLWEWFHFRRARLKLRDQRIAELEARLQERAGAETTARPAYMETSDINFGYRSPGIFLETEEALQEQDAGYGTRGRVESIALEAQPLPEPEQDRRPTELPPPTPTPSLPDETPPLMAEAAPASSSSSPSHSSFKRARHNHYPDDLTRIKGISEVYQQRLYQAGIFTWRQVADMGEERLRAITKALSGAKVEEWPAAARQLAQRHHRQNAVYTGPPPDDLTEINGIGAVNARVLLKAGICTYEQLAAISPAELEEIFPAAVAVASGQPNFARWIAEAARLAKARGGSYG